ncbi:hypothetical protein MGYG_05463 [Nannizzia gypsea CBS 118893]|uniref:Uncharacterized protein n=1 Tax=Arthroderma gypseum (strain ATCC MYA-4604 / CBS 118893) TaxID=535722 RepID=E4UW22_ARTGP|nr:hypothetical protein MGYG_05463 [Nannizzia gypsea CBS 118893]EFR02470.1 hypothetical protein MGYG_05463 [Nannizzia gypsea CBS 118893]
MLVNKPEAENPRSRNRSTPKSEAESDKSQIVRPGSKMPVRPSSRPVLPARDKVPPAISLRTKKVLENTVKHLRTSLYPLNTPTQPKDPFVHSSPQAKAHGVTPVLSRREDRGLRCTKLSSN